MGLLLTTTSLVPRGGQVRIFYPRFANPKRAATVEPPIALYLLNQAKRLNPTPPELNGVAQPAPSLK